MEAANEHGAVAGWLATRAAYAHRPERVEHVETHISHVFLAGERVYKLKKPVRFDFLDFSTALARERACREEVRLNRRLAAETYLGVVPVTRGAAGGYQLGGSGEAVDWVVEMRRLPTELTLDALHLRGELREEHIDRLAAKLVGFYGSLAPLPLAPGEYGRRVLAHVGGNRQELASVKHHLPVGIVERVHGFQLQALALQPELFEGRARCGRIVDGHGDLRPEHICLSAVVSIFDCIEFSADFRRIDVADELSFLTANCDYLGAEWVGPRLWQAYERESGDRPAAVLIDFYKSYRACVRAKVAALRANQLTGQAQQEAIAEARQRLTLADRYAARWVRPLVIMVGGAAGSGKTTLATATAAALGAELLRTDVVRQEMFETSPQAAAMVAGVYARESRERVYEELFRRALRLHGEGISVVLDGTFAAIDHVRRANALADNVPNSFLAIECVCRPETARRRIAARLAEGRDASEAVPDVHDLQRQQWRPWPEDVPQLHVDTDGPAERQLAEVLRRMKPLA